MASGTQRHQFGEMRSLSFATTGRIPVPRGSGGLTLSNSVATTGRSQDRRSHGSVALAQNGCSNTLGTVDTMAIARFSLVSSRCERQIRVSHGFVAAATLDW